MFRPGTVAHQKAIREHHLTDGRGSCSPRMHELLSVVPAVRRDWTHICVRLPTCVNMCHGFYEKTEATTNKAIDIVKGLVEKSETQQTAECDRGAYHQEGPGHRRWYCRYSGESGYRQLWSEGDSDWERSIHRRAHVSIVWDLPYPRLFTMYPHSTYGGGGTASEHHTVRMLNWKVGRIYRQLQGDNPSEGRSVTIANVPVADFVQRNVRRKNT